MSAIRAVSFPFLIAAVAVAFGCSDSESTAHKTSPELIPLPEPQISGAKPEVRRQINEQRAAVEAALGELGSGVPADAEAAQLAESFSRLGLIYVTYEFLDAAEVCFANAARLQPEEHRFAYLHGYLLKIQGRIEEAAVLLERALELDADDAPTMIRLGNCRLELGDSEAAKSLFDRALELRPSSSAALEGLGKLAAAAGDQKVAAELFERAVTLQPTANSLHYTLGQIYRRLGDLEKAEYHLERRGDSRVLVDDPLLRPIADLARSAEFYMVQAGQAMENRRYGAAASSYQRALEYDPGNYLAHRGLSFSLRQLGDSQGAIAQLERALAVGSADSAEKDRSERANVRAFMAQLLIAEGRIADGLAQLTAALEDVPERFDIRSMLADNLAREGRFEEALAEYDLVHAARPESAGTLVKRATVRINLDQRDAALRDFELAVAAEPENPDVRLHYAEALEFLGDPSGADEQREAAARLAAADSYEAHMLVDEARQLETAGRRREAVEAYRRALDLDPKLSTERYGLATLLADLGRHDEAVAEFEHVIEDLPHHAEAHRGLIACLVLQSRCQEARLKLRDALQTLPREIRFAHALARLLATASDAAVRDADLALELAQRVRQVRDESETRATLAMAYAEAGRWEEAVTLQRGLLATTVAAESSTRDRERAEARLQAYESGRPWRLDSPEDILVALRGGPS